MKSLSIVVPICVMIVSAIFILIVCCFNKKKKVEIEPQQKLPIEPIIEAKPEPPQEEKVVERLPPTSIALQDELNDFQKYLKDRIAPKPHIKKEPSINIKKDFQEFLMGNKEDNTNNIFEDEGVDDDEDLGSLSYRDEPFIYDNPQASNLENLPTELKVLLLSDIFDQRF